MHRQIYICPVSDSAGHKNVLYKASKSNATRKVTGSDRHYNNFFNTLDSNDKLGFPISTAVSSINRKK